MVLVQVNNGGPKIPEDLFPPKGKKGPMLVALNYATVLFLHFYSTKILRPSNFISGLKNCPSFPIFLFECLVFFFFFFREINTRI